MNYILGDFLQGSEQYRKAREYWKSLWIEILRSHWLEAEWESPWIESPFEDGNPIFSAINEERSAALRIVQLEPSGSDQQLAAYLDTSENRGRSITEMVIAFEPTEEMLPQLRRILYEWANCPAALKTRYSRFACVDLHAVKGMAEAVGY